MEGFNMFSFNKLTRETTVSGLTHVRSDQLSYFIGNINENTERLDMGWNSLGNRPTGDSEVMFKKLNDKIKFVILRGNSLGKKSGAETSPVYSSFKYATYLELTFNDLYLQKDLAIGLKGLASTPITSLALDSNNLGYGGDDQLIDAVAVLKGLISLNISYNKLDMKSVEALQAMCSAVPSNLEHLDISNNNLGNKIKAIKKLPQNILSLNISDNAIDQLSVEEINELKDSLTHLQTLYISDDEFKKMTPKQTKALKPILAAINKVIFLNSAGKEVTPEQSSLSTNLAAFFVQSNDKKEQSIAKYIIPSGLRI